MSVLLQVHENTNAEITIQLVCCTSKTYCHRVCYTRSDVACNKFCLKLIVLNVQQVS